MTKTSGRSVERVRPRRTMAGRLALWVAWPLGIVLALTAAYFAAAWGLSRIAVNDDFVPAVDGVPIGVSSNGIHANLHLPVRTAEIDWTEWFPPSQFPQAPAWAETISFGWGNRDFYLNTPRWADFDPWVGLKAIIGIGGTALHVAYWPPLREDAAYAVTMVSPEAYRRLVEHILETIAPDAGGRPQQIAGYSYLGNDGFYEAHGRYSPFRTCNEWVREALADAGVRTGVWSPLPEALLEHLREIPGKPQ